MGLLGNIDESKSVLLIIDLQDKLSPVIESFSDILTNTLKLSNASAIHNIPVLITEQYKKGLGNTHQQIKDAVPRASYVDKTNFSACAELGFLEHLSRYERPQIIVVGTEAHVCVLMTCLDLLQNGFDVVLVADAVGSRNKNNMQVAIEQLRQANAVISCAETVIFQWTKKAATPIFKKILTIIK